VIHSLNVIAFNVPALPVTSASAKSKSRLMRAAASQYTLVFRVEHQSLKALLNTVAVVTVVPSLAAELGSYRSSSLAAHGFFCCCLGSTYLLRHELTESMLAGSGFYEPEVTEDASDMCLPTAARSF
jgi:hypothetical protein